MKFDHLDMYVVYFSPLDYPGKWVVRRWETLPTTKPCEVVSLGETYEKVVEKIPPGLVSIQRHKADDFSIVETWL